MSKVVYSYGNREDIPKVIELGSTWWKDSSFYKNTGMEFRPDVNIFNAQYDAGALFIIVGKVGEELVSCYVAMISPYMFNDKYSSASEIVWCIRKDYRKGKEVLHLLNAIEQGLTSSGIDIYNLNVPILEGKDRLTEHLVKGRGFFKQDICLMKEIK